jgi:hypothetical protein
MDTDVMAGFGGKQAWLAVAASPEIGPEAVLAALGLRDLGTIRWRDGLDLAHLTGDRVAVTPPLPGAGGATWILALGRRLLNPAPDVVAISGALGAEVQYFATHRVTELHRWQRAVKGDLVRAFGYVGQTGEVTSWFGEPGPAEREAGLPGEFDPEESTVLVAERDGFRVAGAWSIDPTTLTGPAPGPLRIGAAD